MTNYQSCLFWEGCGWRRVYMSVDANISEKYILSIFRSEYIVFLQNDGIH